MKELSIEEKVHRYDEAINKAKSLYKASEPMSDCNVLLETLFPKLKESKEERIMKVIYGWICIQPSQFFDNGFSKEEMLAWLEKQGEQKYIPKYKIGDYVKNTNYKGEPIYEIVYMDKECYICEYRGKERMGDKAVMHFSFDNPYLRLVQKPAEKLELNKLDEKTDAWSEEDERNLNWLITVCERIHYKSDPQVAPEGALILRDWLKSLRLQNHWKPSDYELEVLKLAAEKDGTCLMGLYEQLKKLREE